VEKVKVHNQVENLMEKVKEAVTPKDLMAQEKILKRK
jgi:hypothetical protein